MIKTNTIAAIATGMTASGIGIIRISGEDALSVIDHVYRSKGNCRKISSCESHTVHYGYIYDGEEEIDEVMVLLMRAPHSYTMEDCVEIDCHGGVYVMKRILETVIKYGARPAEPGEFTKRAFLNGRIDLTQAESVIDVIHSENEYALQSSLIQLKGTMGEEIRQMREVILHEIAFIESALDDPEHISLDNYPKELDQKLKSVMNQLRKLIQSADNGRLLKEGIKTVILGKPNAGKSSLLNRFAGEERAIVTDIAGTTRDLLEEKVYLDGLILTITDTAGIRNTEDAIEKIGVVRARREAENADLILYVMDSSAQIDENDREIIDFIKERNCIVLLNKSDLPAVIHLTDAEELTGKRVISFSAKSGDGLEKLEQEIRELFFHGKISFNDQIYITNVRQKNALQEALHALELVKESICNQMPEDFYSIDLMDAYEKLGMVVGEAVEDDLVDEIFSQFCMGK